MSGLEDKLDGLIRRIKEAAEHASTASEEARRPYGLLAQGERQRALSAARPEDPRRSKEGRRSGHERRGAPERRSPADRRSSDRRVAEDRRLAPERRQGDRRSKPPIVPSLGRAAAAIRDLRSGPEGLPTEIAGMPVSPRLARLIEIVRREKTHGKG
ncbi:MAG TPA: hypothetical protein VFL04_09185 [Rectinemataceae bacterium]|nr:hypothetical protein [Rectinemataceae bacterium]